jgi:hypothetical protein
MRRQCFAEFVRGFWSDQKGFGSQPTTKIWLEQRAAGQGRTVVLGVMRATCYVLCRNKAYKRKATA